jgi:hypothetical protein
MKMRASPVTTFYNLVNDITREFPDFAVIPKEDSKLMLACYYLGLMRFWNPVFMTRYITTAFGKVYMPAELIGTEVGADILRHELVHLRDAKKWGILFYLSYFLFPLPAFFTMRAYWEFRGYCESLRCERDRYGVVYSETLYYFISLFTGPSYLWMCPFPKFVEKQFLKFLEKEGIRLV